MVVVRTQPCPNCKKLAPWEGNPWRPFCSERCRNLDLGKWATGAYRVPGPPVSEPSEMHGEVDPFDASEETK